MSIKTKAVASHYLWVPLYKQIFLAQYQRRYRRIY